MRAPDLGHRLVPNDNTAASGFYKLAVDVGELAPDATEDEKFAFWVSEVRAVYEHYRRARRRR